MSKIKQIWVPRQHGAWAMLIVPFIVGCVYGTRNGVAGPWLVFLGLAVLTGYLAFDRFSSWHHAAPKRRKQFWPPLIVYGALTIICSLATILLAGWQILWWAVPAAPFALAATVALLQKQDRSILSGLATVALASGVGFIASFLDLPALITDWSAYKIQIASLCLIFGYFFGTVLYVKTMIRERGNPDAFMRSVGYHVGLLMAGLALIFSLQLNPAWLVFCVALVGRAIWVPKRDQQKRIKQAFVGVGEIILSCAILALALL